MTRANELPAAIQWHEGMLLAPQHFQQLSLRQERLLHYHASHLAPFHHGVIRLRLDNALLLEGTIRVLELEAILPDGLVVSHSAEAGDLQIDVKTQAEAAKLEPVLIHLAVPAERPAGSKADGDLGRFASLPGDPVYDESTGERPLRIPRLRPRLRLLAGAPAARFVSMPLLGLRYKNGQFVVSDYIPPQLHVTGDSPLGELCAGIARRVREKGAYLVEIIRSPAMTTKPAVIEENKRLLAFLTGGLPAFEAVLRTGAAHPVDLYIALCGVAGSLTAVGTQLVPPVFPAYDHAQLRRCFDDVRDYIFRTIDEGVSESFTAIPLTYDSGAFGVNFERDWANRVVIMGVKGQPGMSDKEISDWMKSSLVGSQSRFRLLRERRLLGAERAAIDRYEGLVAVKGMLLFKLTPNPEFVVANEPLMVSNATDKLEGRPAEIFLYVANKG